MSAVPPTRSQIIFRDTLRAVIALVIALAVGFVLVWMTSSEPAKAFHAFLTGPMGSKRTRGVWIDESAKLCLSGLAFALVFQARQFSMGVQGQVFVGGLMASLVALSPLGHTWAAIPLGMIVAMLGGAIYGFIPGYAKARFGASEIVSSLMLNYIAILVVNWIVRVYLAPPHTGQLVSPKFPKDAIYPALIPHTRFDLGAIIALVIVALVWFVLYRTTWGLKLRLVGDNPRFAEYAGIKARTIMVTAMSCAGAIGGLLGSVFVQGTAFGRITTDFDGGLAFEGILIAIVARNKPLAIPIVALAYGYLRQGAVLMGLRSDVPSEMLSVVQALIILLVASQFTVPVQKLLSRLLHGKDHDKSKEAQA